MITEHAVISIRPGTEADFEADFPRAVEVISRAKGCLQVRMLRGIERPSTYLLLIQWESVEAHTVGFRESPAFGEWRAIIGPYFDDAPEVEHFEAVAGPALA